MYYKNRDGSSHERHGIWLDNDLRGEVRHYFLPSNHRGGGGAAAGELETNRTEIEFWNADGFYVGERDENDLPHGQGTMNFHQNEEDKKKFQGLWFHGVKNGFGVLTWKNGDMYVIFDLYSHFPKLILRSLRSNLKDWNGFS